jgi:reactive intermediate/imine deaminase
MPIKQVIATDLAPKAIGPYNQAIRAGNTIYFSGQIALDPKTMQMVQTDFLAEAKQVFENLQAVAKAAGASYADFVKVNIYLTDLGNFAKVNELMASYFPEPYPARAAIQAAALPRGATIEIEGVAVLA